ncbi:MAG: TPM domain-containing protein [Gemmataceae bacterium]|nr:TPM domain-containing protein [Gemmataceae bacterium]
MTEAVKKADEQIREIYRKHDFDLLIETFATVPADQAAKVKAMDTKARSEFFVKWAQDRSKARAVRGIYILLCQEPRHMLVGVTTRGQKTFPPELRKQLQALIRDEFARDRFDEGLHAAVKFVEQHLAKASAK